MNDVDKLHILTEVSIDICKKVYIKSYYNFEKSLEFLVGGGIMEKIIDALFVIAVFISSFVLLLLTFTGN